MHYLDSVECPQDELLNNLRKLFFEYLKRYENTNFTSLRPDFVKQSHRKYIFERSQHQMGILIFEAIIFNDGQKTGPHIHPRFIIDSIQYGSLHEELFEKKGELYFPKGINIRKAKDQRTLAAEDHFPHDVMAIDGNCLSFCLTLGHETVREINVASVN